MVDKKRDFCIEQNVENSSTSLDIHSHNTVLKSLTHTIIKKCFNT